jgi:hypothetical protein
MKGSGTPIRFFSAKVAEAANDRMEKNSLLV